jgi:hypothetical protein
MPRAAVVQVNVDRARASRLMGRESWQEMRDSCLWTPSKPSGWRTRGVASFSISGTIWDGIFSCRLRKSGTGGKIKG